MARKKGLSHIVHKRERKWVWALAQTRVSRKFHRDQCEHVNGDDNNNNNDDDGGGAGDDDVRGGVVVVVSEQFILHNVLWIFNFLYHIKWSFKCFDFSLCYA